MTLFPIPQTEKMLCLEFHILSVSPYGFRFPNLIPEPERLLFKYNTDITEFITFITRYRMGDIPNVRPIMYAGI